MARRHKIECNRCHAVMTAKEWHQHKCEGIAILSQRLQKGE